MCLLLSIRFGVTTLLLLLLRMAAVSTICTLSSAMSIKVSGVNVHRVPLRGSDPKSPWCYAATMGVTEASLPTASASGSAWTAPTSAPAINFLATQVWPSARAAACAIERHVNPRWTVCELGCGPGLPSLTAATIGCTKVIATDVDPFALQLVQEASKQQRLPLSTQIFDLTSRTDALPMADLYVMSDVFELSSVARGAAFHTHRALERGANVWVFTQADRVQREIYLSQVQRLLGKPDLQWSMSFLNHDDHGAAEGKLWLCDVDETAVHYDS